MPKKSSREGLREMVRQATDKLHGEIKALEKLKVKNEPALKEEIKNLVSSIVGKYPILYCEEKLDDADLAYMGIELEECERFQNNESVKIRVYGRQIYLDIESSMHVGRPKGKLPHGYAPTPDEFLDFISKQVAFRDELIGAGYVLYNADFKGEGYYANGFVTNGNFNDISITKKEIEILFSILGVKPKSSN